MNAQRLPVTGGCLCGAVRYASEAPPIQGYYCHCTRCQKSYGGLFSVTMSFPAATFSLTKGELKFFHSSSFAKRGFCANCGAPIAFFADGVSEVWIKVGSLDHPEDWPLARDAEWGPSAHWHTDSKVSWYKICDDLPQPADRLDEVLKSRDERSADRDHPRR